jgi:hypothetical protein
MKKNVFAPANTIVGHGKVRKKTLKNEDIENVSRSALQKQQIKEETSLRGYQRKNAA